jgi:hypothetical protein
MWKRYTTGTTGSVERVGPTSTGALNFYDTATCFELHPAAADLQMMTTGVKIIGGAGEIARYFVGAILDFTGFANAVNNLPGYRVTSVAVNGADLDILLWDGNNTLIAEAAGGARSILLVCRSCFSYCGAANAASFGGYTDWRVPNAIELLSLADFEAASAYPNATAFPNFPSNFVSSTTVPNTTANYHGVLFSNGSVSSLVKTTITMFCEIVRG